MDSVNLQSALLLSINSVSCINFHETNIECWGFSDVFTVAWRLLPRDNQGENGWAVDTVEKVK